jgi:hypothetical protein
VPAPSFSQLNGSRQVGDHSGSGSGVASCHDHDGPVSSGTVRTRLRGDPLLQWVHEDHRWWVKDRSTGQQWGSGMDAPAPFR